jgi:hypothetical protein
MGGAQGLLADGQGLLELAAGARQISKVNRHGFDAASL